MVIHGKQVVKRGGRLFAVPKGITEIGRAGLIAQLHDMPANLWGRIAASPVGSQVIVNQKRADGRRDARMARLTRASRPRYGRR